LDVQTILIFGPPRSGTTLLTRLLGSGDGAIALSEPFQFQAMVKDWFLKSTARWFQRRFESPVPLPKPDSRVDLLRFLRELAGRNRLGPIVIKEVFHEFGLQPPWRNLDRLDWLADSGAAIVGIVRHPCDTVDSTRRLLRRLLFGPVGVAARLRWPSVPRFRDDLAMIRWAARNWSDFVEWARERGIRTIRYEDLAAAPERVMDDVCADVGLRFESLALNGRAGKSHFAGIGDPGVLFRPRRAVHGRSVGRGQRLTPEERAVVQGLCAAEAEELGYRFEAPWAVERNDVSRVVAGSARAAGVVAAGAMPVNTSINLEPKGARSHHGPTELVHAATGNGRHE